MNLRTGLATLTLALASLASVPALAGGFHTMPAGPPVTATGVVARPSFAAPELAAVDSRPFATRVRAQMLQIERAARLGVARRELRPQVLTALRREESQIDASLRAVTRRPVVTAFDARRIEAAVRQMSATSASFQTRVAHR